LWRRTAEDLWLSAAEDEAGQALTPDTADPALDMRVRVRRPHRRSDHPRPVATEDRVEGAAELAVTVVDQESAPRAAIVEVHQQVARLLQHPPAVRVARAGHVLDPAAADADEEEDVQPPQPCRP
jgi:hypothetical protein